MKKFGRQLEFISLIKRDGSGVIPVGTPWTPNSNHAKTDDTSYLDNERFRLNIISFTKQTYIASGFNTWVVKLKSK